MTQSIKIMPLSDEGFTENTRFQVYTDRQLDKIEPLQKLSAEQRFEMRVVASVLPFRVNQYVIDELIDWDNVPNDPIFQLTFPQRGMLEPADYDLMAQALRDELPRAEITQLAREIQARLNPHPAGQQEMNVPMLDGEPLDGMQHKYRETVLFFPSQGQICHSYCTFCFRWAQFIGDKELRFASNEADSLHRYLAQDKNITDLLITGGDPMVMKTRHVVNYLEPLLKPELEHMQTREMETPIVREAIRRIRATGAVIRAQAPLVQHINDDPDVWVRMWRTQVRLGIIPYYMFVERDTGAKRYFEVPLVRAFEIYRQAIQQVSGLARTARGPSMSAGPGKVEIQSIIELNGEKVFVLRFIQGRNPDWVQQTFFAKYDENATWYDDLVPAFGEEKFFFTDEYNAMISDASAE